MDPALNDLFRWSVEQSDPSRLDPSAPKKPLSNVNPAAFANLLGLQGFDMPSDADMMKKKMAEVRNEEKKYSVKHRVQAFEDFEMMVQNLDNANNIAALSFEIQVPGEGEEKEKRQIPLWDEILAQLESPEYELRLWAAWTCGTATQNNIKTQERILIVGGIPPLVKLAIQDDYPKVRKKAVFALSSIVRNFQPGLDEVLKHMPKEFKASDKMDASDMEAITELMDKIRETIPKE
jgi:hypothetical protein